MHKEAGMKEILRALKDAYLAKSLREGYKGIGASNDVFAKALQSAKKLGSDDKMTKELLTRGSEMREAALPIYRRGMLETGAAYGLPIGVGLSIGLPFTSKKSRARRAKRREERQLRKELAKESSEAANEGLSTSQLAFLEGYLYR